MTLTQSEINQVMEQLQPIIAKGLANSATLKAAQSQIQQGVTQYIGARYVPLFADPIEWDSQRAYDPLTIVLHEGSSYTSRQYTPTGIDIANEEFWACTGNYNAQVEQYRQEVKTYDSRITQNTNDIAKIKSRKGIVIGDSYTQLAESTWVETLSKMLNMPITKYATSSMGYTPAIISQTFINNLETAGASEDSTLVDFVMCYGGVNDWNASYDSEFTAVNEFCIKAKELFPTSKIIIVGPQCGADLDSVNKTNVTVGNAIMTAAQHNGCTYVNPSTWLFDTYKGYGAYYADDRTHPNADGYNLVASNMLSIFTGQKTDWAHVKVDSVESIVTRLNLEVSNSQNLVVLSLECVLQATKGVFNGICKISNFGFIPRAAYGVAFKVNENDYGTINGTWRLTTEGYIHLIPTEETGEQHVRFNIVLPANCRCVM